MRLPFRVAGTGSFLPGPPIDNEEVVRRGQGLPGAAWIEEATGIRARHFAGAGDSVASMAEAASRLALEAAGLDGAALKRVLLVTSQGGDRPAPATSYDLAHRLGVRAGVADIGSACQGWLFALDLGARLVATGEAPVLIVASELLSRRVLNPADPRTWPIFGDGAAAVVIDRARGDGGLVAVQQATFGEHSRAVHIPGPDDPERVEGAFVRFGSGGKFIRDQAEALLGPVVEQALREAGLSRADLDYVVPHQPNAVWLRRLCRVLDLPIERVKVIVDHTANLSSVMVPMGLDHLWRGELPPRSGQHALMCSIGSGVGVAAMVLRVD